MSGARPQTARAVFDHAFRPSLCRTPRSAPYRAGVMAILELRLEGKPLGPFPYAVGSAEADAFFAGQDEGNRIVRMQHTHRTGATA